MELTNNFDFDTLQPQEFFFKFRGRSFVLCEAPESAGSAHLNAIAKQIKFSEEGKPVGVSGGSEQNAILLSQCIKEIKVVNGKEQRGLVSLPEIQSWPTPVTKPLISKAKQISGLETKQDKASLHKQIQDNLKKIKEIDEEEKTLKNLQSITEDTSNSVKD